MFFGISFCAVTHYITGKFVVASQLSSVIHILCNAAFRSVTLCLFLLRIAAGPEFGNALHHRKKGLGNELRSAMHNITGLIILRIEFAIIYGRSDKPQECPLRHVCNMDIFRAMMWIFIRKTQEGCGGLRDENPGAFPKAGPIFQQPFSLPENAQTLAGIAFRADGKSVKNCPAASKFARKLFQQGISDSHSVF